VAGLGTGVSRRRGGLVALALGVLTTTAMGPVPAVLGGGAAPAAGAAVARDAAPAWEPPALSALGPDVVRLRAADGTVEVDRAARGLRDLVAEVAGTGDLLRFEDLLAAGAQRVGATALFEHEEETPVEPGEFDGELTLPAAAGDLDGDGVDDLVVVTLHLGTGELTLEAVRGADGASLWTRDGDGGFPLLAGDLDGDGAQDLLLYTFDVDETFESGCTTSLLNETCEFSYEAVGPVTVSAVDGRTGDVTWSSTRDISFRVSDRYEQTPIGVEGEFSVAASGLSLVLPVGDLDADGADDLVASELDDLTASFAYEAVFAGAGPVFAFRDVVTTAFDATSRQVRFDGGVASTVYDEFSGAGGAYFPLPLDVDGDGTTELLLNRFRTTASTSDECVFVDTPVLPVGNCSRTVDGQDLEDLELVSGDGTTRWVRGFAPVVHFPSPAGDLDGEGGTDLLVERWPIGPDPDAAPDLQAVGGSTGAVLWDADVDFDTFPIPAGDLDADGADDVLFVSFEFGDDEVALRLDRATGATGERTGVTSRLSSQVDEDGFGAFAFVGTDLRLDTVPGADLVAGLYAFTESGVDGLVVLERGSDATRLRTLTRGDGELFGLVDLDGDGVDDVITSPSIPTELVCFEDEFGEFCFEEPSVESVDLTATSLATDEVLWTLTDVSLYDEFVYALADLDGDGGVELARERSTFEETPDSFRFDIGFTVLRGSDAAPLWSRGRVA
jgi:hypothetical protein